MLINVGGVPKTSNLVRKLLQMAIYIMIGICIISSDQEKSENFVKLFSFFVVTMDYRLYCCYYPKRMMKTLCLVARDTLWSFVFSVMQ